MSNETKAIEVGPEPVDPVKVPPCELWVTAVWDGRAWEQSGWDNSHDEWIEDDRRSFRAQPWRLFHLTDTPPAPQPTISEGERFALIDAIACYAASGHRENEERLRTLLARLTGGGK